MKMPGLTIFQRGDRDRQKMMPTQIARRITKRISIQRVVYKTSTNKYHIIFCLFVQEGRKAVILLLGLWAFMLEHMGKKKKKKRPVIIIAKQG